jgi:hypothetical protein
VAIVAHAGQGTFRTLAIININPLTHSPPLCGLFCARVWQLIKPGRAPRALPQTYRAAHRGPLAAGRWPLAAGRWPVEIKPRAVVPGP